MSEPPTSIATVLNRPYLIDSGKLTTTSGILSTTSWPDEFLKLSAIVSKVSGFTYLRSKIRFTLVVNCDPNVACRLMMSWYPYGQYSYNRAFGAFASATGRTTCPNAQLDPRFSNTVSLEVDHVAPAIGYDLTTGAGGHGMLQLSVYGKVADVQGLGVEWSLYAQMVDAELTLPTRNPMFTDFLLSRHQVLAQAQIGTEAIKSGTEAVKAISTIAEAAGPLMSLFGWSKPVSTSEPSVSRVRTAPSTVNVDGVDTSVSMGTSVATELDSVPAMFGREDDDMKIANIVSRPAFISTVNWSNTATIGTLLKNIPVNPAQMMSSHTTASDGIQSCYPTPMCVLSQVFAFWRGSITFTLKPVCTNSHAGRLRVSWTPSTGSSAAGVSEQNYSTVFDLSSPDPMVFTVPWAHTFPWRHTRHHGDDFRRPLTTNGTLSLTVEQPLRHSALVSNYVEILIEAQGGPDFEFAVPVAPHHVQFNCPDVVVDHFITSRNMPVAQVGTEQDTDPANRGPPARHYRAAGSLVHGESTPSIRSVIKAYTASGINFKANKIMHIEPWMFYTSVFSGTYAPNFPYTDFFSYLFAFYRGSKRFKFYLGNPQNLDDVPVTIVRSTIPGLRQANQRFVEAVPDLKYDNDLTQFFSPRLEGPIEVAVPMYGTSHMYPCIDGISSLSVRLSAGGTPLPVNKLDSSLSLEYLPSSALLVRHLTTEDSHANVLQAAGDDFSFGYLVGAPRMYYRYD
jgi:hypothetical protein